MTNDSEETMLFPWIEKQIETYCINNSIEKSELINLGIGDTCHTLPPIIRDALKSSIDRMAEEKIGYGKEQGLLSLRNAIANNIYPDFAFSTEEIFITEGIANSLSMLIRIFPKNATIGILSPTYPVYKTLLELLGINVVRIDAGSSFKSSPTNENLDGVIICSPNNPTGVAYSKERLTHLVRWAKKSETVILYDGAYESFLECEDFPKSIYSIDGAKEVAIEMRSFSKSLGFSGLRLGYFTVPKELHYTSKQCLPYFQKMIAASTNGVSYPIQEAGVKALSDEGLAEIKRLSCGYMAMTKALKHHLLSQGHEVIGGIHAPYIFWKVGGCSKKYFSKILTNHQIISIPGVGFGRDGFLRLSGFIEEKTLKRACDALTF